MVKTLRWHNTLANKSATGTDIVLLWKTIW